MLSPLHANLESCIQVKIKATVDDEPKLTFAWTTEICRRLIQTLIEVKFTLIFISFIILDFFRVFLFIAVVHDHLVIDLYCGFIALLCLTICEPSPYDSYFSVAGTDFLLINDLDKFLLAFIN